MKFNILFIVLCPMICMGQTVIPNTFNDGTPALAEEVNENFKALLMGISILEEKVENLDVDTISQSCSNESMSGEWSILIRDTSESTLCLAYFEGSTWLNDQGSCTTFGNDGSQVIEKPLSANFSVDSSCKVTIQLSSGDGSTEVGFGWMAKDGLAINGITQNSLDNIVLTWKAIKLD